MDEYSSCIEFHKIEYSYNYLKKLAREYSDEIRESTLETVYYCYVDDELNKAVIGVDEKTLAIRTAALPEDSPVIFEHGHPAIAT